MDLIEDILDTIEVPPAGAPLATAAAPTPQTLEEYRDRVRGMLFGVALGDALGSPHEFRHQVPLAQYTGRVEFPVTVMRRFQGGRLTGNVGQISDDTEMTIALADTIAKQSRRIGWTATAAYLDWANSHCPFLGKNTRALFVGVRTVTGYRARWQAARAAPEATHSQSNGCLMRAAPLAALPEAEWEAAAVADCMLTNFHPTCVDAVRVYVLAARVLLAGGEAAAATAAAIAAARRPEVAAAVTAGRDAAERNITGDDKGWVLHALYCAFYALNTGTPTYQDRVDMIVRLGGDTDTNAAIAGALLGAQVGEKAMRTETRTGPNLEIVLAVNPAAGDLKRPPQYAASRIPALADHLAAIGFT